MLPTPAPAPGLSSVILDFVADSMPVTAFASVVSRTSGVSVVVHESLDNRTVTLDAVGLSVPVALGLVARRLECDLTEVNGAYYLGATSPLDKVTLVRRLSRWDDESVLSLVNSVLGSADGVVFGVDGVLVVTSSADGIERLQDALEQVERLGVVSYVVQLFFIAERSKRDASSGIDGEIRSNIAAALLGGTGGFEAVVVATGVLEAVLSWSRSSEDFRVIADPLFVLADGETAEFNDGEELRIPLSTVSDQGTVTQTGFEVVPTGLTFTVTVRDAGAGRCRLTVDAVSSQLVGIRDGLPQVSRQTFQSSAFLTSGSYLLGSFSRSDSLRSTSGINARESSGGSSRVDVWARVYPVSGPVQNVSKSQPRLSLQSAPGSDPGAEASAPKSSYLLKNFTLPVLVY